MSLSSPGPAAPSNTAPHRRVLHILLIGAALLTFLIMTLAAFSNLTVLFELQSARLDNAVSNGRFDDYVAFYAAGELVVDGRGSEIYQTDVISAKEQEIMGRPVGGTGSLGFFNPPFVAVLFAPLSLLSVGIAGVVLFAINAGLVLVAALVIRRLLNLNGALYGILALVTAVSLNSVFWLLGHGQLSMLLMTGLLGFFWFQREGKSGHSGLALALLLVKPQVAILPILVLVWRRDWQALKSFSIVASALVLISVGASGLPVLLEYPTFALSSTGWDMEHGINVERMYGWNGLFASHMSNHSLPHLALTTAATLATVGLVLSAFGDAATASNRYALAFGAMVAGAILINPHIYLQDLVLMSLVVLGGYLGTRELGWSVPLWLGIAAVAWFIQEGTDRIFNAFSLNGPSILLVAMLFVFTWVAVRPTRDVASREARPSGEPIAA